METIQLPVYVGGLAGAFCVAAIAMLGGEWHGVAVTLLVVCAFVIVACGVWIYGITHPTPNPRLTVWSKATFPIWEAACLASEETPERNLTGSAARLAHDIKRFVADEENQAPFKKSGRRIKLPESLLAQQVDRTSDSREITRATFKAFALSRCITIRGLTDA